MTTLRLRTSGFVTALVVAAITWFAAPTICRATPITYTFSSNAIMTFADGSTEAVVGSFTIDPALPAFNLSNINISLTSTQTPAPAEVGVYNVLDAEVTNAPFNFFALATSSTPIGGAILPFGFIPSLDTSGTSQLVLVANNPTPFTF